MSSDADRDRSKPPAAALEGRPAPPPLPAAATTGFSARLVGAPLYDLIQFECLQRSRRIVRVTHGERTGYLYFRDGNLVHALDGPQVGEAAVRSLLRWTRGAFEACEGPWPPVETLTVPWQALLLRAAQAEDDERRSPKVLSFPTREGARGDDDVTKRTDPPSAAAGELPVVTVRLSPAGELIGGDGPDALVDATAYGAQLADIVAELLGLERFTSLELVFEGGACVVVREPDGTLLAARGQGTDAAALWQRVAR